MNEQGVVDLDRLHHLLDCLVIAKVNSIKILGSTGSYMYVSQSKLLKALKYAVDTVQGSVPIIASVGALRNSNAQHLARDMHMAGCQVCC